MKMVKWNCPLCNNENINRLSLVNIRVQCCLYCDGDFEIHINEKEVWRTDDSSDKIYNNQNIEVIDW